MSVLMTVTKSKTGTQESSAVAAIPVAYMIEDLQPSFTYRSPSQREVSESALESDVLVQLKANLAHLEDMQARMQFMMSELSYLLVKRS